MTHYRLPRLVASIALLLLLPAVAMAACAFSPTAPDVLWKFEETAGTALAESVGGTLTATADQHAIVNTPGAYAGSSGFRIPVAEDPSPANPACGTTVAWSLPADACMTDGREIIARVTGAADGTAVDFEGSSAFTLSAWVLRDTASNAFAPTHAPIVWQGATTAGPFGFFMTATGVGFQISLGAPTAAFQVVSTNELDDGFWHHLVGVFDGTDLRLYIDGVLDSTDPLTGAPATPTVAGYADGYGIGFGDFMDSDTGTAPGVQSGDVITDTLFGERFYGSLDDVAMYSSALSATEINGMYVQRTTADTFSLVDAGGWSLPTDVVTDEDWPIDSPILLVQNNNGAVKATQPHLGTQPVTFTLTTGSGSFTNGDTATTFTICGVAGDVVPTKDLLQIDTADTYQIDVTSYINDGSTLSLTLGPFTVYTRATQLVLTQQPIGNVLALVDLSQYPTYEARDIGGTIVTSGPHAMLNVTLVLSSVTYPGGYMALGTEYSSTWMLAASGEAAFSTFQVERGSNDWLVDATTEASGAVLTAATSNTFTIYQRATQLVFDTEPSGDVFEDQAIGLPVIHVKDAYDQMVADGQTHDTIDVTLTLQGGPAGHLVNGDTANSETDTAVSGGVSNTFPALEVERQGSTWKFQASITTDLGTITADSATFTIWGRAASLVYTQEPVGDIFEDVDFAADVVMNVLDQHNDVVTLGAEKDIELQVELRLGPGNLVTSDVGVTGTTATTVRKLASNGICTIDGLQVSRGGAGYQLRLTPVVAIGGFTQTDSAAFDIYQVPTQLVFTTPAVADVLAYTDFSTQPVVEIRDADGVKVTVGDFATAEIVLTLDSGPFASTVLNDTVDAVAGVATFTAVQGSSMGTQTLHATLNEGGETVTQAQGVQVTIDPSAFSIAFDVPPIGNVETDTSLSQLPTLSIRSQDGFTIASGAHSTLEIRLQLQGGFGGGAFTTPEADTSVYEDTTNGEIAVAYDIQVSGQGTDWALVATLTDAALAHVPSTTSVTFTIHGVPDSITVATEPVGDVLPTLTIATHPVIRILDRFSNEIQTGTHVTTVVSLTLNGGVGAYTGNIAAVASEADFTPNAIAVSDAGTGYYFTADIVYNSLTIDTGTFTIFPPAAQLVIVTQPLGGMQTRLNFTTDLVVEVRDAFNTVITTGPHATMTVSVALDTATCTGGALDMYVFGVPSTASDPSIDVVAVDGVADFDGLLVTRQCSAWRLEISTAADTPSPALSATSDPFVVHGTADSFAFDQQPVGDVLPTLTWTQQPIVHIVDTFGELIVSGPDSMRDVRVQLINDAGTLAEAGTPDVTGIVETAVAGVATFADLSGSDASTLFALSASMDALPGVAAVSSAVFTIYQEAADLLLSVAPLGDVLAYSDLAQMPTFDIVDASLAVITDGPHAELDVSVYITLGSGDLLPGALVTMTAVAGRAAFTGLQLTRKDDYKLQANTSVALPVANVFTSGETAAFHIFPAASYLVFSVEPVGDVLAYHDLSTQPEVTIFDEFDQVVDEGTDAVLVVDLTMSVGSSDGEFVFPPASRVTSMPAVAGVAAFVQVQTTVHNATWAVNASLPALPSVVPVQSADFEVFPVATGVVFDVEPVGDVLPYTDLGVQPVVHLVDLYGSLVDIGPHATLDIELELIGATPGFLLNGTGAMTVLETSAAGVATYTDLQVSEQATTWQFRATCNTTTDDMAFGVVTIDSATFTIYQVARSLTVTVPPVGDTLDHFNLTTMPEITILDRYTVPVTDGPHSELSISLDLMGAPLGSLTPESVPVVAAVAGVADSFAELQVTHQATTWYFNASTTPECPFDCGVLIAVDTVPFTIHGYARSLTVVVEPVGDVLPLVNIDTNPVVHVLDHAGNVVLDGPHAVLDVHLSVFNGLGGLIEAAAPGVIVPQTTTTATGGVATWADGLQLSGANTTWQFNATTTAPALFVETAMFTIYQLAASVVYTTEPVGDVLPYEDLQVMPVLELLDLDGNLVTVGPHSMLNVTLTLGGVTPGFLLNGTETMAVMIEAVGGVVTAADLQVSAQGTTWAFNATTMAYVPLDRMSADFTIYQVATSLTWDIEAVGDVFTDEDLSTLPVVAVRDVDGNRVIDGPHMTTAVTIELWNEAAGELTGGFDTHRAQVNAVGGTATFPALQVTGQGTNWTFNATATPSCFLCQPLVLVSSEFTVWGVAFEVRFDVQPVGDVLPTLVLATAPEVGVYDVHGNHVVQGPHSNLTVLLTLDPPGIPHLLNTNSTTQVNQSTVAGETGPYSGLALATASTAWRFVASLPAYPSITVASDAFTVYQIATSIVFGTQPVGDVQTRFNLTTMPVVRILDMFNETVWEGPHSVLNVTLTLTGGHGGPAATLLESNVSVTGAWVNALGGYANYSLLSVSQQSKIWTFDAWTEMLPVTVTPLYTVSAPFLISGVIGGLTFEVQPIGDCFENEPMKVAPVLTIRDDDGNIIVDGPDSRLDVLLTLDAVGPIMSGTVLDDTVALGWADNFTTIRIDTYNNAYTMTASTSNPDMSVTSEPFAVFRPIYIELDTYSFSRQRDTAAVEITNYLWTNTTQPIDDIVVTIASGPANIFDQVPTIPYTGESNPPTYGNFSYKPSSRFTGSARVHVQFQYGSGSAASETLFTDPLVVSFTTSKTPAPVVSSFKPPSGPTQGGTIVTIAGEYFGKYSSANLTDISVGGIRCANFVWQSNNKAICRTAPVLNPNVTEGLVQVTCSNGVGVSTTAFGFNPAPVIEESSSYNELALTPEAITIYGSGFGLTAADLTSVSVAGQQCETFEWINSTAIFCQPQPALFGLLRGPITVSTVTNGVSSSTFDFTYMGPSVTSVTPTIGSLFGGTVVTVFGSFFNGATSVELDGFDCLPNVVSVTSTQIVCVSAPGNYTEACVTVTTETGGTSLCGGKFLYSVPYDDPVVSDFTPREGQRIGGYPMTIYGEYFFNTSIIADVTIAGESCLSTIDIVNTTLMTCTVPFSLQAKTGPVIVSSVPNGPGLYNGNQTFTYLSPTPLDDGMPFVTDVAPLSGSANGGDVITATGFNFGATSFQMVSVRVAGTPCPRFEWVSPTAALCLTPPVSISSSTERVLAPVTVHTRASGDRDTLSWANFTYEAVRPIVVDHFPRTGLTTGGEMVTIVGELFGKGGSRSGGPPDSFAITISGRNCVTKVWVSETELVCEMPPSLGMSPMPPVFVVTIDKVSSVPTNLAPNSFKYVSPTSGLYCGTPCGRNGDCIGGRCVCRPGFTGAPKCALPFLSAVFANEYASRTSEDGGTAKVNLQLSVAPSQAVTVFIAVSDATEAGIVNARTGQTSQQSSVIFAQNDWDMVQSLTLRGKMDELRDGPVAFQLGFEMSSSDASFNGASSLRVFNDESKPVMTRIQPGTIPLGGHNITITGRNFDTQLSVRIGDVTITDVQLIAEATDGVRSRQFTERTQDEFVIRQIVLEAPELSKVGYKAVEVINAGGTRSTNNRLLYYTAGDCIEPGLLLRDNGDCIECPKGAFCPGGNRIWAEPGYWTPDETSGFVYQCIPAERCPGTVASQGAPAPCAEPYTGDYCGECMEGYGQTRTFTCEPCPSGFPLGIVVMGALFVLLAAASTFVESRTAYGLLIYFIMMAQTAAGLAMTSTHMVPDLLQTVYSYLVFFIPDHEGLALGCNMDLFVKYGVTAGLCVGLLLPLLVLVPLAKVIVIAWYRYWDSSEEFIAERRQWYNNRMIRNATVWLLLIYYAMTMRSLELLACHIAADRTYFNVVQPTVTCWEGMHIGLTAVACIMLLAVTLYIPVGFMRFMNQNRVKIETGHPPTFLDKWSSLFEPLKSKYTNLGFGFFFLQFAVAISHVTIRDEAGKLSFIAIAALPQFLIVLARRPYKNRLVNSTVGMFFAAIFVTAMMQFMYAREMLTDDVGVFVTLSVLGAPLVAMLVLLGKELILGDGKAAGRSERFDQMRADALAAKREAMRDGGAAADTWELGENRAVSVLEHKAIDEARPPPGRVGVKYWTDLLQAPITDAEEEQLQEEIDDIIGESQAFATFENALSEWLGDSETEGTADAYDDDFYSSSRSFKDAQEGAPPAEEDGIFSTLWTSIVGTGEEGEADEEQVVAPATLVDDDDGEENSFAMAVSDDEPDAEGDGEEEEDE